MKKMISIALIFMFLFESSGLKELVKMPILIHHFYEHKAKHPADNFLNYIAKHYNNPQESESAHDKETDQQLPFKSSDSYQAHISAFIVTEYKILPVVYDIKSKQYNSHTESAIITRSFDIWQPPKSV